MTQLSTDLDVLKEIPGFKAILKSVLKSQIQLLIEQLSEHTGEESIILTASIHDGSLSHLGSGTGKGFLEGREEIKSQFLGYCLKTHHKQKTIEARTPYQRTHPSPRKFLQQPNKRPKLHSGSLQTVSPGESRKGFLETSVHGSLQDSNIGGSPLLSSDSNVNLKSEVLETQSVESSGYQSATPVCVEIQSVSLVPSAGIPSSVHLTHSQTSHATKINSDQSDHTIETQETVLGSDSVVVKAEPNKNEEEDLEITGVEIGNVSLDSWGQGQMGYSSEGENSISQDDLSGYNLRNTPIPSFPSSVSSAMTSGQFVCVDCKKCFSQKGNLLLHRKIHTGQKPFVCQVCNKAFRRKHHLQGHMITHMTL